MNYVFELIYQQLFFCVCNLCDKEFGDGKFCARNFKLLGSLGGGLWKIVDFISFFDDDNQMVVNLLLQSGKDKRIYV